MIPGELVVHRLVHEFVPGAHDLRDPDSDNPDHQPRRGGERVLGPRGKRANKLAQPEDELHESQRGESADHAQSRVGGQLGRVNQAIDGDAKQRLGPQKPAHRNDA